MLCVTAGAGDVVLQRVEPEPASQQFPCPLQRVKYECRILRPTAILLWILPSGEKLPDFTRETSVGTVHNSSDGEYNEEYSATLTGKMEDGDPNSDDFFFNSTLLIINSTNGTTLRCVGTVGQYVVIRIIIVLLSGELIPRIYT